MNANNAEHGIHIPPHLFPFISVHFRRFSLCINATRKGIEPLGRPSVLARETRAQRDYGAISASLMRAPPCCLLRAAASRNLNSSIVSVAGTGVGPPL